MLKDSEVHEIRRMQARLLKYDCRLAELLPHTENSEHDYILLAKDAIDNAHAHLSWVAEEDDRGYENYSPSRSKIWVDED